MIQREWTGEDYIGVLRRRWMMIILLALAGSGIAYGISRFLPNMYQSQSLVLIERPTVPTNFVKPVSDADINQRVTEMEQRILSPAGLEPVVRLYGLSNGMPMEGAVAALRNAIDILPVRAPDDSGNTAVSGFYVRVTMNNPQTAQVVCAAITSLFVEDSAHRRQEQAQETTKFLAQQIVDAKSKLDAEDAKLAAFESRHLGSLPEDQQQNLNFLGGLTAQLDAATQAVIHAQQDKNLAESMLAQQVAARQASQTGQNPDTYGEQLAALQTHLSELQATYTDDYPDVIKTKIQIETLKKKLADSENQKGAGQDASRTPSIEPLQFTQLRAQIRADEQTIAQKTKQQEQIQQEIKSFQERIQLSPLVSQEYKQLTRDHQSALEGYNDLLKKRADSVMAGNLETHQEGEQFVVLNPANLPHMPSSPNRPLFALGGLGGGAFLGIGLAFLFEMRDTSLRNERDVELLVQFPVLAVVPQLKGVSNWK